LRNNLIVCQKIDLRIDVPSRSRELRLGKPVI